MYIERFDMWLKISNSPCKKIDDENFLVPMFEDIKKIGYDDFGLFREFVKISRSEMEEDEL